MIHKNKVLLIITSLILLLPLVFGLCIWNKLPSLLTVHWGIDGTGDGVGSRAFVVFGMPLILLAFHWLCILVTAFDHRKREQSPKVFRLVLWIIPLLSLFANGLIYATAFGVTARAEWLLPLLIGVMFLVIGNYLPKCRRNHTIGIKLPWTLAGDDNWQATHRLGGRIWTVTGLLILLTVFLPATAMLVAVFAAITVAVVVPTVYSYRYYRRQLADGTVTKKGRHPYENGENRTVDLHRDRCGDPHRPRHIDVQRVSYGDLRRRCLHG